MLFYHLWILRTIMPYLNLYPIMITNFLTVSLMSFLSICLPVCPPHPHPASPAFAQKLGKPAPPDWSWDGVLPREALLPELRQLLLPCTVTLPRDNLSFTTPLVKPRTTWPITADPKPQAERPVAAGPAGRPIRQAEAGPRWDFNKRPWCRAAGIPSAHRLAALRGPVLASHWSD